MALYYSIPGLSMSMEGYGRMALALDDQDTIDKGG